MMHIKPTLRALRCAHNRYTISYMLWHSRSWRLCIYWVHVRLVW